MVLPHSQDGGCLQTPQWAWGTRGAWLLGLSSAAGLEKMPWVELRFPPCRYYFCYYYFGCFLRGSCSWGNRQRIPPAQGTYLFPDGKFIPFGGCPYGSAKATDEDGTKHSSLKRWRSFSCVQGVPRHRSCSAQRCSLLFINTGAHRWAWRGVRRTTWGWCRGLRCRAKAGGLGFLSINCIGRRKQRSKKKGARVYLWVLVCCRCFGVMWGFFFFFFI